MSVENTKEESYAEILMENYHQTLPSRKIDKKLITFFAFSSLFMLMTNSNLLSIMALANLSVVSVDLWKNSNKIRRTEAILRNAAACAVPSLPDLPEFTDEYKAMFPDFDFEKMERKNMKFSVLVEKRFLGDLDNINEVGGEGVNVFLS